MDWHLIIAALILTIVFTDQTKESSVDQWLLLLSNWTGIVIALNLILYR